MKYLLTFLFFTVYFTVNTYAQHPPNGTYVYAYVFLEYQGRSLGATVRVKIKGDSIFVYHNGGNLSGTKGELMDSGVIMKHKTGRWIIGHTPKDKNVPINPCDEGPTEVDFVHKKVWAC